MGDMPFQPAAATQYAEDLDKLFGTITALTLFFTVVVMAVICAFVVIYRKGSSADRTRPVSHNTNVEIAWTVPPLILGLAIFLWAAKLFAAVYHPPKNAKEIFVIGKQWMWHVQHPNGIRENNELHVPVGEPIKLTMISQDVIHAFYVPEFRIQRQVLPGTYTALWFEASKPGRYHLYCNMYCGTQHSEMGGWVYVMTRNDFDKWQAQGGRSRSVAAGGYQTPTGAPSLMQEGAALYRKYQCASCHDAEAVKRGAGPSLIGIYGKTRQLANGQKVVADDKYLHDVLYYPNEYALAGWPIGMPSYKGAMSESEVLAVNAYVKSLGTKAAQMEAGTPETTNAAADTTNQSWRYMYGGELYR